MASGDRVPGYTPKWLRHQRKTSGEDVEKELSTTSQSVRSIETSVRILADRIEEVQDVLSEMRTDNTAMRDHLGSSLNAVGATVVQEMQATLELHSEVTTAQPPMPSIGGWAMDASSVLTLLHLVRTIRPSLIVECGSGSSTVWTAYVLEKLGTGRILSLEHDPKYAEKTRAQLWLHGLGRWATVIHAPLVPYRHLPDAPMWYDLSNLPVALPGIDLLVVDGPPAHVGRNARYPAVPVMEARLANSAAIVLDDTGRPDEQAVLKRWMDEFPELTLARVQAARAAFAVWNRQVVDQGAS